MNPCPALWADFDGQQLRCGRVDESGPTYQFGEPYGVWRLPQDTIGL